jgi:hypothetical protein
MSQFSIILHGGGLPHADTLGVPVWLQWLVVGIALAIAGWLVVDARQQRRTQPRSTPGPVEHIEQTERADTTTSPTRERLVRTDAIAQATRPKRVVQPRPVATTTPWSPPRLLVLLAGFAAGWIALDRVRGVDALGSFIKTDGAAQVARLGFSFAALLWVGAALAPVAPRGSALAFGVAGAIGTFLATASSWERRLEWWGATAVLNDWDGLPYWAGAAFVLALLTLAAGHYQPRRGARTSLNGGTIPAADSAKSPVQRV